MEAGYRRALLAACEEVRRHEARFRHAKQVYEAHGQKQRAITEFLDVSLNDLLKAKAELSRLLGVGSL